MPRARHPSRVAPWDPSARGPAPNGGPDVAARARPPSRVPPWDTRKGAAPTGGPDVAARTGHRPAATYPNGVAATMVTVSRAPLGASNETSSPTRCPLIAAPSGEVGE